MDKKTYCQPEITRLGNVAEITKASTFFNCDTPCGSNDNNAFAPPS